MSGVMKKADLIAAVAEHMGSGKREAGQALDAVAAVVSQVVAAGGKVVIPGLAKFEAQEQPERQVRNPRTGETMIKPAGRSVKVSPASSLRKTASGA